MLVRSAPILREVAATLLERQVRGCDDPWAPDNGAFEAELRTSWIELLHTAGVSTELQMCCARMCSRPEQVACARCRWACFCGLGCQRCVANLPA